MPSDVDTELDNLLERVAVKSANQYGGFEGWDDEADKQDVIGESREAIKALIGTIAEQIIGEDETGFVIAHMHETGRTHRRTSPQVKARNKLRAEQHHRLAQLMSTPVPQDGSVTMKLMRITWRTRMSREIKFRAWFPKEHYSEPHMAHLDINDDFGGNSATWQLRYLQHPEPDGPIYMQYTGMKDKNGVEIYEGDILRHFAAGYHIGNFAVRWDDNGFWDYGIETKNSEVIGNIYENSELLEKSA